MALYDFFISYKHADAKTFSRRVRDCLKARDFIVWHDDQIAVGDSISDEINRGLASSAVFVPIFSVGYFEGKSKRELAAGDSLMMAGKSRLAPVWFKIDEAGVRQHYPLVVDIRALIAAADSVKVAHHVCDGLATLVERGARIQFLFQLLQDAGVADPDVDLFCATFNSDLAALRKARSDGCDINITDWEVITRHKDTIIKAGGLDVFTEEVMRRHM